MAGNAQELIIRLKIEDGTYKAELQKAEKATKSFSDQAKKSGQETSRSFTEINQAVELAQKGFRLLQGASRGLFDALDRAQTVEGVTRGFQTLQTQAGLLADDSLAKLRDATKGLVADFDLMQSANQAVQLGLDPAKLDVMAEAAVKLGAAVGRTGTEAFGDLITGVGRASPLILDNLGITVKAAEAQQYYADKLGVSVKALTEQQKAEAFRVAALDKIQAKAKELADIEETAAAGSTRLKAAIENQTNAFVTALSRNEDLNEALGDFARIIAEIDLKPLAQDLAAIASAFISIGSAIGSAIDWMSEFRRNLSLVNNSYAALVEERYGEQFKPADSVEALEKQVDSFTATIARAKEQLEAYEKSAKGWQRTFSGEYLSTIKSYAFIIEGFENALGKAKDKLEILRKTQTASNEKTKVVSQVTDDLKKKIDSLTDSYRDLIRATEQDSLKDAMEAALKVGNTAQFDALKKRYAAAVEEGILDGTEKAHLSSKARDAVEGSAAYAAEVAAEELIEKHEEAATKIADDQADKLKDAYQESVDFWSDAFYNAMTGAAFDFEDIMMRAAAGVAGGFVAEITGGLGSGIGSITDLGGILGSALGGNASAGSSLTDLIFGASGAGVGGPIANSGSLGLGSVLGGGGALAGALPWVAGGAAILGGGYLLAEEFTGSGKSPQERQRDAIRDQLRGSLGDDLTFSSFGRGGSTSLYHDVGEDGPESALAERMLGIADTITTSLGGAGSEWGNVFANAVSDAEDYNHALASVGVFLGEIGVEAESLSEPLKQAFLNGEIALNDFGAQLQQVNDLQNANLEGVGNIDAALALLAESYDEPQKQMFALEALFNEFEETGVTSLSEIGAALEDKLGPEARAVFEKLESAGITSFRGIENASADQVFAIFSGLNDIRSEVESTFGGIDDSVEQTGERMRKLKADNESAAASVRGLTQDFRDLKAAIEAYNRTPVKEKPAALT